MIVYLSGKKKSYKKSKQSKNLNCGKFSNIGECRLILVPSSQILIKSKIQHALIKNFDTKLATLIAPLPLSGRNIFVK